MTTTIVLPVYLRVGDCEESQVGEVTVDSAAEAQRAVAELLREAADEIERQIGVPR